MIISVFDTVENIVGKREIACTSNFFFSHNVFKRVLSQTHQKVPFCGNGLMICLPLFGNEFRHLAARKQVHYLHLACNFRANFIQTNPTFFMILIYEGF